MSFYVLDFPGMEPDEPQITKARLPLAKVRLPALPPVIQLTTVLVLSGFQQKHMSPKELPFHVWSSTVSLKCFALSPASACLLGNLADANAASQYNTILYDIIVYYSKIIVYIFMDIWQSRHILDILRRLRLWCACHFLRCIAMFCCFTPLQNHSSKIPVPLSEASRCNLQPWVLRRKANDISMPGGVLVQAEWGGAA